MRKVKVIKFFILLVTLIFVSCDSTQFSKTPLNQFEGIWELKGRDMFKNMQIEIRLDEEGKVQSKIVKLNDNKYVSLFLEEGDEWVKDIRRTSNYEFVITEKKIAAPLFSQYGNSTSKDWNAVFKNENCIGVSESKNAGRSKVEYCRVK
ncbi:MAG: hypothetical protein COA32_08345 [Fluviicola sp.]|nr:MAG: hypothetical protein COA32_08345 [Fluviicola sp.]